MSILTMISSITAAVSMNDILSLIAKFVLIGGGIWLVWGVIVLAGGLKDNNGPDLKAGIWQVVGGGMILAAAAYFNSII